MNVYIKPTSAKVPLKQESVRYNNFNCPEFVLHLTAITKMGSKESTETVCVITIVACM